MTENLAEELPSDSLLERALPLFTVHAESPSALRLSGELDVVGVPALASALEPLVKRGGTIEIDLSGLIFLDSTGINALCEAADQLGERGRIVVLHPTHSIRRVLELTGVVGIIDINDDPLSPHRLD